MNYKDVTDPVGRTNRRVDAQDPHYECVDTLLSGYFTRPVYGSVNKSYGAIKGQRPTSMARDVQGQKGMQTSDINGAAAGSKTRGNFTWKTREQFQSMPKAYNDCPGVSVGTLKRSIETKRQVNPLNPAYQNPGHTEPGAGLDCFGDGFGARDGCSMFKSFTQNALNAGKDEPEKVSERSGLPPKS